MIRIISGILLLLVCAMPARAETDVWLFRGWGPEGFSTGIDQLGRRIQTLRGVGRVTVLDYTQTQQAYDEARATPPDRKLVFGGYSCGANSALNTGAAFEGHRTVHVLGIQPSLYCGRYWSTSNMALAQDTFAPCGMTYGFGCLRYFGRAQKTVLIERPSLHLQADTDPLAQRDVMTATYCIANSAERGRCAPWVNHLRRTTYMKRFQNQNTVRLHGR
jgi:hypothetical protein